MMPLLHLNAVVAITVGAYAVDRYKRHRREAGLRKVAGELDLNYTATDQFRLTDRVADRFPIPGAAALVVSDLIYGIQGERYRYIFTCTYTVGAVRMKKRLCRVATISEPLKSRGVFTCEVQVASDELGLLDQYRALGGPASVTVTS